MRAYRYYRCLFKAGIYYAVNEIGMYESSDASGTNLLTGSTVTSSGAYASQTANLAIDGNAATYWGSATNAANRWLAFDLGTAETVSSIKITSTEFTPDGWNAPREFDFQGSDDGSTWELVATCPFNPTSATEVTDEVQRIYTVDGTSLLDTASATTRVLVFNWSSGTLIHTVIPEVDGTWSARFGSNGDILVTHIGPSGFQPISDGPVTPY